MQTLVLASASGQYVQKAGEPWGGVQSDAGFRASAVVREQFQTPNLKPEKTLKTNPNAYRVCIDYRALVEAF